MIEGFISLRILRVVIVLVEIGIKETYNSNDGMKETFQKSCGCLWNLRCDFIFYQLNAPIKLVEVESLIGVVISLRILR